MEGVQIQVTHRKARQLLVLLFAPRTLQHAACHSTNLFRERQEETKPLHLCTWTALHQAKPEKKRSSYPKEVIGATQGEQKQLGKEEEIRKHSNQIISHQTTVKCLGGKLPKMNFNEIFKGVDAY